MKSFKIVIPVMILIAFFLLPSASALTESGAQRVPDFVTSTLEGDRFVLTDWLQRPDHKVLVLTFLATWCGHCDEDLKFLQRLQEQYADQGLRVLCVFTGSLSRVKEAQKYLEGLNIELPILLDPKRVVSKRYQVPGFPSTYAIDRDGILRIRCVGCSDDVKTTFERNLRNLLTPPEKEE